jgi:hypothetical protein
MKKLVLVLGMHRSGTSMTTGVLNKMGLNLGGPTIAGNIDNPKGFFESFTFLKLNEIILRNCNARWDEVDNALDLKKLMTNQNEMLLESVIEKFDSIEVLGIKDPRICILLPLYEKVCKRKGIDILKINVKRKPENIVKSLNTRDGFSEEKSLRLINQYGKLINEKDFTIKYEDLLHKTDETLYKIKNQFNFLNLKNIEDIKSFIDLKLNRSENKMI